MNVVLIAILFGLQAESTSVLEKNETSGTDVLAMETNSNATITVKWDLNNRFLTIVTTDSLSSLCNFNPDCNFALRLDATGIHPIRATDGTLLNGGFDDYWSGFVIVG